MASNLACVGLAVSSRGELEQLVATVLPQAVAFGRVGGLVMHRWQDPSGARLVLAIDNGHVEAFVPSFAASHVTPLGGLRAVNSEVATAAVLDDTGEQMTSVALELEQHRLLPQVELQATAVAISFLGRAVTVHEDAAAFQTSSASLLDATADAAEPAPSEYIERGWAWPPCVAAESFFSHGAFRAEAESKATGRFAGLVLEAERRRVKETGQAFVVARVHTTGINASVCLSGDEFGVAPTPGQVIAGEVFIVGSAPALDEAPTRATWWRRRRS